MGIIGRIQDFFDYDGKNFRKGDQFEKPTLKNCLLQGALIQSHPSFHKGQRSEGCAYMGPVFLMA